MMDYLLTVGEEALCPGAGDRLRHGPVAARFPHARRSGNVPTNRIATNIHVSNAYVAPPIKTPVSLFLASEVGENSYPIDVEAGARWR